MGLPLLPDVNHEAPIIGVKKYCNDVDDKGTGTKEHIEGLDPGQATLGARVCQLSFRDKMALLSYAAHRTSVHFFSTVECLNLIHHHTY